MTERIVLDEFHWHEALDRTHVLLEMFDNHIVSHPAISQTDRLKAMVDSISESLASFYQEIGGLCP